MQRTSTFRLIKAGIVVPVVAGWLWLAYEAAGVWAMGSADFTPQRWLAGMVNAITAAMSVANAIRLAALVPVAIALQNVTGLQEENRRLEQQLTNRKLLEEAVDDRPLRQTVAFGLTVAVISTALMGFLSWRSGRLAAEEADWVAHSHTVIATLGVALQHVGEAETNARTFAMTAQNPFLTRYDNALGAIAQDRVALRNLTADNAGQQRRLQVLWSQIAAALAFAAKMVNQRRQTDAFPGGVEILETERLLDSVHETVQEMQASEAQLLTARIQRTKAARRLTSFFPAGGTILGTCFLVLAWFGIRREISTSARARSEIVMINAGREQRVEQRTEALQCEIDKHLQAKEELSEKVKEMAGLAVQLTQSELEVRVLNEGLEARVAERTAQLQAANKELESFTYSVSHDLRAPLRHVSGFSRILMEEFGPTLAPEAQRHLQRIQDGTRKMGILVDEMLNLARTGRHSVRLQAVPLNAMVAEVIAMLSPETKDREIEWKLADLPVLECDPVLMKQVLQNLIANALKFSRTRSPAVIEIGFTADKENTTIFVRDNGVGFNMKYSDKLFGVFQHLHRDEEFEGTGVGLATVQRIIQKHGGRVWAEAELDRGATFYFTLGTPQPTEQKNELAMAGA